MPYFAAILLAALFVAECVLMIGTGATLPVRVASHFNFEGVANGYMARSDYLLLMAGLGFGVPVLLLIVTVLAPCLVPNRLRIPSRDYWIAPERRRETLSAIVTTGLIMAAVVTAFMTALNLLVVEANTHIPPRMEIAALMTMVALLVVSILISQFYLWRRFQVAR